MSRELAPPMVMRHLERAKDPLPAIGTTPHRPLAAHDSGSPRSLDTSPKSLNDSPTMVGSLALARRRHRTSPEQQENRSPSPDEVAEEQERSTRRQHALLDVLDPDADGSVCHRSEGVSPTSRHHGKLEPLDPSALSHTVTTMTTKPHQISPLHK